MLAITLNVDFDGMDGEQHGPSKKLVDDVTNKLNELQINCLNLICTEPIEKTLDRLGLFGIPATLVYRDGQILRRFQGAFSYETDVVPFVEALIR